MKKRSALFTLYLLLALAAVGLPCNAQTEFELRSQTARKANPSGLKLALRTTSGRSTFHLYETIPVEWVFSNAGPSSYFIELDEKFNLAGQTNRFEVSDSDSILMAHADLGTFSIACCNSHLSALLQQPTILKRELTDFLRFAGPGTYSVFLVTNRVFKSRREENDKQRSNLTLTSNILTLTILPDDPEWDSQQLSAVLQRLNDPKVKADYFAAVKHARNLPEETAQSVAMLNVVARTELVKAEKTLNVLDSDEAIRHRVEIWQKESKEDTEFARKHSGMLLMLPKLELNSTTRPEFLESVMRQKAAEPEFGVDYSYVWVWSRFLVQRNHPEVHRPMKENAEIAQNARNYRVYQRESNLEIVAFLESQIQNKRGEALEITTSTIKDLKSYIKSPSTGSDH